LPLALTTPSAAARLGGKDDGGSVIQAGVIDDTGLFRAAFSAILTARQEFAVVVEGELAKVESLARATRLDVIVHCCIGENSALTLQRLQGIPSVPRILVVAERVTEAQARRLLSLGAAGILLQETALQHLSWAILSIAQGGWALSPEIASPIIDGYLKSNRRDVRDADYQNSLTNLSPREGEVLALLSDGLSNRSIGDVLNISAETVKDHVRAVCTKLNVKNRFEAARLTWQAYHDE
jgi:DNA-binding NarL/FixJ family response regulator